MSNSTFTWDPNSDQTYNGDIDLFLPGTASSFNKAAGTSFTMDAPWQTLTLQITPSTGKDATAWGIGSGSMPTVIEVKRGTLVYDASVAEAILFFAFDMESETNLIVRNDAQFRVQGSILQDGEFVIYSTGIFNINVQDEGVLDLSSAFFAIPSGSVVSFANIAISGKARMAVGSSDSFQVSSATIHVTSRPDTGHSLEWATKGHEAQTAMVLAGTAINFEGEASSLLKAPTLTLTDTRMRTADAATTYLQSDSVVAVGGSQFVLGPGKAKVQFDAYSQEGQPFHLLGGEIYPQGMFEITSEGSVNGGEFLIREKQGGAIAAAKILAEKLIAIDGEPQDGNSDRVRCRIEADGYIHIRQIR